MQMSPEAQTAKRDGRLSKKTSVRSFPGDDVTDAHTANNGRLLLTGKAVFEAKALLLEQGVCEA